MSHANLFAPYNALAEILLPRAIESDDGSHDIAHLSRVWKNASRLQRIEGGDLDVIAAAVILHDCVSVEKNSPERSRSSALAARKAAAILVGLKWPTESTAAVFHAIEAHSFSAGVAPESVEAKIVQDADRLDAIGAIGIARCFYTAGRIGSKLYEPFDPSGDSRAQDDRTYALDHFSLKLLRLAEGFQTATGGQIARQRHDRLAMFWRDFLEEIE